ncbi:alpha-glucosidase [Enterococcus cecorum]|uniref:alpha-glucosidase n=1 Tax=Enterococcus cecorum TaxID=44008 RepID=UPI002ACA0B95|nr:alpha-glucosidase [Enterococcus cecorum]MDZ5589279.1 alpha-glucosidase [Enterococcus cecorum]
MKEWWQSEIIYQIYPRSFQDSNQDGIGDIQGIIQRLDYLHELGITTIWISPIFESPMADNGYDISNYFGIASEFGTMEDFKELVLEAKKRQIKILLDLVVNHTSDEHPWFQQALANPQSKYRDYYIFKAGKKRPNNWRSIFGGSVWEKLPNEDMFYYHTFHKKQPDLNWENPQLRSEIHQMIIQWLQMGIAGFRVDAITFIKKDLSFKSIEPDGVDGLAKCTKVSRNQPGIEVFLKELQEKCFQPFKAVTVAEAPGVNYDELDQFIGKDGFFSMIFDFKAADLDVKSGNEWFKPVQWQLKDLYQKIENSQLAIQKVGWGAPFIENHDQNRATSKYLKEHATNPAAQKALALMYFYLYGTSFIYQGQEIGMINFQRHHLQEFDDISSIDQYHRGIQEGLTPAESLAVINYRSRDNARTPMQWTDETYVGFSSVRPWLAITEQSAIRNVEAQMKDETSLWYFYKKIIAVKKMPEYATLTFGKIDFLPRMNEGVLLYRRYTEEKSFLIVSNLTNKEQIIQLDKPIKELILNNDVGFELIGKELKLSPFAAIVLQEEI